MAAQADDDRATGTRLEGSAGKPQTAKPSGPLRDTSDPDHRPSLQLHPNREAALREFRQFLVMNGNHLFVAEFDRRFPDVKEDAK